VQSNAQHPPFMRLHHPSTSPSCIILDRSSFATRDCKQPATVSARWHRTGAPIGRASWGFLPCITQQQPLPRNRNHCSSARSSRPALVDTQHRSLSTKSACSFQYARRDQRGCSSSLFLSRIENASGIIKVCAAAAYSISF
jgi:hypothetical protein